MLKRNLVANFVGQGWVALMGIAFVPLYIKYLGIESYGLVGFFSAMQAWLSLLDLGMTPSLSREMARFSGGERSAKSIRDLLRSIEIVAIGISFSLILFIGVSSSWLSSRWLKLENLSSDTVNLSFTIMGFVLGLRLIEGIYRGAIVGLQNHVIFNVANSMLVTLRSLGSLAVLFWYSPTIDAFFIIQGISSLLSVLVLGLLTYALLPRSEASGKFSKIELCAIAPFAGGVVAITLLSLLIMQTDKVLLSTLLSLSNFGYYAFASTVAGALYMFVSPIGQACFPRLNELHARKDFNGFSRVYHQGAQFVTVFMGSAAVIMVFYAKDILFIWTGNEDFALKTAFLVKILSVGNLLNGMMWMPYQAQLAHGWTELSVKINLCAVFIIVPSIYYSASVYGGEGVACVWVLLNFAYVIFGAKFMFRKILTAEKKYWCWADILLPLGASIALTSCIYFSIPIETFSLYNQILILFFASCVAVAGAAFAAPLARPVMVKYFMFRKCGYKGIRHVR